MSLDKTNNNDWNWIKAKDFMIFNPRESVKKGTAVKNVPMDKIEPKTKEILNYEITEYKSGVKFRNGDTLMARITPCLENGKISQVSILDYNEIGAGSTEFIVLREKEGISDKDFIYYLSNSEFFKEPAIKSMVGSSGRQRVQRDVIENLDIYVPPLETQKKIGKLLSYFDDKISLNKKINKNLEQLSQNLFRKWFIDFDLKNDFNMSEPFKESNLGEIPESWEIKTIGDLSDVKGRIGWRGYTTNDLVDEGPWVVGGKEITSGFIDFNSAKHLTREKYDESPEIMLRDKDLIIAKTGTIGPIAMYYEIYGEATLNPNVGLIRSKNIAPALLLTFFKTPRAQYYLNEFTTSSVQPAINQTTIKQLEVALPSDKQLLNKIGAKFEEINLLQFNLNEETKKLQRLRDTLLPKLMSGEIDVSKINCDLIIHNYYLSARFSTIFLHLSVNLFLIDCNV